MAQGGNRFSALLLEGLDHYRSGRMLEAVRAWEEAYLLEPTNLRAREFLRSALERIHAVMSPANKSANPGSPAPAPHPWLPAQPAAAPPPAASPAAAPPPAAPAARKPAPPAAAAQAAPKKPAPAPKVAAAPQKKAGPPRNPWDEGPSLAIPQPEVTGDGGNAAWSIHKVAAPSAAVSDDETDVWMRGAREPVALNDSSGPLEQSLSAPSSRAPRIHTSVSSSETAALGAATLWIDQAAFPPSPVTSGWGMASEGPSSQGLRGGPGFFCAAAATLGAAADFFGPAWAAPAGGGFRAGEPAGVGAAAGGTTGAGAVAGCAGSQGCGAGAGAPGLADLLAGDITAWIRSSAERRNSRARRFVGSSRYASSHARTASSMRPLR